MKMSNISLAARVQIIDAEHFMALIEQSVD